MLSDVLYRTYLHQWTCHPEQEDAIRARKTNEILSDVGSSSVYINKRFFAVQWCIDKINGIFFCCYRCFTRMI